MASHARQIASNSSESITMPTPVDELQQSASNLVQANSRSIDRTDARRNKRQSSGREQLCQTTYQYITPQAALNSQGNLWIRIEDKISLMFEMIFSQPINNRLHWISLVHSIFNLQKPNDTKQRYIHSYFISQSVRSLMLNSNEIYWNVCSVKMFEFPIFMKFDFIKIGRQVQTSHWS